MPAITDSEKIEILFNKSFGVATTQPGGLRAQNGGGINANDKIVPALQVFSQYIPPVAPDDSDLVDDVTFNSENMLTEPPPGTLHPFTGEPIVCKRRHRGGAIKGYYNCKGFWSL